MFLLPGDRAWLRREGLAYLDCAGHSLSGYEGFLAEFDTQLHHNYGRAQAALVSDSGSSDSRGLRSDTHTQLAHSRASHFDSTLPVLSASRYITCAASNVQHRGSSSHQESN